MLIFLMNFILLLPQQGQPSPLTAQSILDAHKQGVSTQALLAALDGAAAVTAPSEEELKMLIQAGVAPEVIQKLKDKSAPPPTEKPISTAPGTAPDDPRLLDIARLVKSALSEDVVIQQIRYSGESYKPSVNDLLYLKGNQVPESVIQELIQTHSRGLVSKEEPKASPKPKEEAQVFQPLLFKQGFLKANATGSLSLKEGRLEWLDAKKSENNYAIQVSAVKTVWLDCSPRPQGNFCYEISLRTFNGDTYSFYDFNWETGGNAQILALYNALKKDYPQIIFQENTK